MQNYMGLRWSVYIKYKKSFETMQNYMGLRPELTVITCANY